MSNLDFARIGGYTMSMIDDCFPWEAGWEVRTPAGRLIRFPTAKMALDWIRFDAFGAPPPGNTLAAIGRWLVEKYRTQVRMNDGASHFASLNMKKQGVPREFRNYILEGV